MTVDPARIGGPDEPVGRPVRGPAPERASRSSRRPHPAARDRVPRPRPDARRRPSRRPSSCYRGRIVEFLPATGDPTDPDVRIVVARRGAPGGETVDGYLQGPSGRRTCRATRSATRSSSTPRTDPDSTFIAVADLYRIPALALLLVLFAVAVTVVGGWRGVRSLIALALTLAVIVKIVVPLILAGWDPVWVAIVAATGVTIVTFLLTEGARTQTVAAVIGTFASLALVASSRSCSTSSPGSRSSTARRTSSYLQAVGLPNIDLGGLFLAGDHLRRPRHPRRRDGDPGRHGDRAPRGQPVARRLVLARRAMNVGRSHIAATVNTLVLAYVGASLPLIVLFAAGRQDPLLTASMEIVAVEVVRAIVGSIGIVAAVPLTTAVAVAAGRSALPFSTDRAARRAASTVGTDPIRVVSDPEGKA